VAGAVQKSVYKNACEFIKVCFPSGLTFCQLKSTERYENVSRALAYTRHGTFSDGNTVNKYCEWPKNKTCRIVKIEKLLGWPVLVNIENNTP